MDPTQLSTDEEALLALSATGFSMKDWPFISRMGALNLLSSEIMRPMLNRLRHLDFRQRFDQFLKKSGFIISPLSYPSSRLFKCPESCLAFFGRFNPDLLNEAPAVSVVGSRRATSYGLMMAQRLSTHLAKNQVVVVSGGASGIDQAAHRAALLSSGRTIAISGTALDFSDNDPCAKLLKDHPDRSLVIYPFGPFIPQQKYMFVERNRYVASMADALVVVEGQVGSGTLHTANFAKKLDIPLFAVPGSLDNPESFAPNHLLEVGAAKGIRDFSQFALSWVAKQANPSKRHKKVKDRESAPSDLPELLKLIKKHEGALGFDDLLKLSGKSFAALQRELFDHELSGRLIKRGAQFVLAGD